MGVGKDIDVVSWLWLVLSLPNSLTKKYGFDPHLPMGQR